MGRSQESFNKREKEKKRLKKQKEKRERREQRKLEKEERGKLDFSDQIRYLDADGNPTTTPPDPTVKKEEIDASEIVLGIPKKVKVWEDPVRKGRVSFFNHDKGYGFINDSDSGDSIFVHANNVTEGTALQDRDKVSFEVEQGPKGPIAVKVKVVE